MLNPWGNLREKEKEDNSTKVPQNILTSPEA